MYKRQIKNITGVEALILSTFYETLKRSGHIPTLPDVTAYIIYKEDLMKMVNIDEDTYLVSIHNLMRMQCIGPAIIKGGPKLGKDLLTVYKGADAVVLTPLGVKFVEACIK